VDPTVFAPYAESQFVEHVVDLLVFGPCRGPSLCGQSDCGPYTGSQFVDHTGISGPTVCGP